MQLWSKVTILQEMTTELQIARDAIVKNSHKLWDLGETQRAVNANQII